MMSTGIWLIAAVLVVLPAAARSEITERKECRTLECLPTCFPGTGPDGCPSCDCPPTCEDHQCPDDKKCVLQDVRCKNKRKHCFPRPTCVPKEGTSLGPTSTVCPTIISCGDPIFCYLDYPPWDECPVCLCYDPACMLQGCPPGQQCLPTGECPMCYECLPKFVTTDIPTNTPIPSSTDIPTTTDVARSTTTSECPIPPCAVGCRQVPGSDGCPICDCTIHTCQEVTCDLGQECVMKCPSDMTQCFPQATCVPIIITTPVIPDPEK